MFLMKCNARIWSGCLLPVMAVILFQCSPRAGKSLLNFFFDGVPGNDSTLAIPGTGSAEEALMPQDSAAGAKTEILVHVPYGEKECSICHDENAPGTMVEPQPGLCYLCHEDLGSQYNYLHGPVAGGYCTSCHDPHISRSGKLLRYTGDGLCFYCHDSERLYRTEMHGDLDGMVCMDCHNAHGGEDRYIFY
jgi:predicted CXXCH cytochrome family protein